MCMPIDMEQTLCTMGTMEDMGLAMDMVCLELTMAGMVAQIIIHILATSLYLDSLEFSNRK